VKAKAQHKNLQKSSRKACSPTFDPDQYRRISCEDRR